MSTDAPSVMSDHSGREPIKSLVCPKCDVRYPNIHELLTHQRFKRHFLCNQCDSCFWTEDGLHDHKRKVRAGFPLSDRHVSPANAIAQDHRPDTDLECFGCQFHFTSAASFWRHLESGQCSIIYPSDIARLRENKIKFAEQLEIRKMTIDDIIQCEKSHIKEEDTWASEFKGDVLPSEPPSAPDILLRPVPIQVGSAHPLYYHSEDFPALLIKEKPQMTPVCHGDKKHNVWSDRKSPVLRRPNITSTSYNSVPPPVSYETEAARTPKSAIDPNQKIRIMRAPKNPAESGPHVVTSSGIIVDPDHPDYNPAVFYNEMLDKFVCPYKSCRKKFHNVFGLTTHLGSPAHKGVRISCISCRKTCTTVAQLIGHMETTTRCPVRGTDGFRRALGQITGGILDFQVRSGIFCIDKNSVQELLSLRLESTTLTDNDDFCAPKQQKYSDSDLQAGW
ncbi:hypothetical protein F5Y03DRAFT_406282 [Xylaria venustula]|nr:hypothetical protein F5Y03DRAFT_406282 [Xylaria venustula]